MTTRNSAAEKAEPELGITRIFDQGWSQSLDRFAEELANAGTNNLYEMKE